MVAEHAHLEATPGPPTPTDTPAAPAPGSSSMPGCPDASVPLFTTSPSDAAAAILASDAPLPAIAAELKLPRPDLIKILTSPDAESLIASIIELKTLRADHREARSRLTGLTILEEIAKDPEADKVERRRAATAILLKCRPHRQAAGSPGRGGRPSPPNPRPAPDDASPQAPDNESDNADLDDADLDEDGSDGADCASNRARVCAPKPAPRFVDLPKPPLDITPDALVAHQLALIQSIDKPVLTPRDIVHAIDFHNLAFPNRYYADLAIAFQNKLADHPILESPGAQLTAEPAIIHDTTTPTATVRVTIRRPADAQVGPADAQCLMPDASSFLFHLIHESTFFRDPQSPHAWHTKSITRDDSG